jgi:hypothetical protein
MSAAAEPAAARQPPAVDQPQHPLHALTTYELREYRKQLEGAIEFFDRQEQVPPARGRLAVKLHLVVAEQESRERIARADIGVIRNLA